jgi:N-acetylgalactosamine 4-sulfate 6-O-sulfotransferase
MLRSGCFAGDVFKLLPQQLNPQLRNPCWGGTGPQMACLPYFNIIGVSKCGTTDLYRRLTLHKEILPARNKASGGGRGVACLVFDACVTTGPMLCL